MIVVNGRGCAYAAGVTRLEAVDRIDNPILLPIQSGEGHEITTAHEPRHQGIYRLVETLDPFRHLGVEFVSLREQIDTGSPLGQAIFTIITAIAQLERSLIAERVRAGLRRAKAEGSD